jgi:hypothetical protein
MPAWPPPRAVLRRRYPVSCRRFLGERRTAAAVSAPCAETRVHRADPGRRKSAFEHLQPGAEDRRTVFRSASCHCSTTAPRRNAFRLAESASGLSSSHPAAPEVPACSSPAYISTRGTRDSPPATVTRLGKLLKSESRYAQSPLRDSLVAGSAALRLRPSWKTGAGFIHSPSPRASRRRSVCHTAGTTGRSSARLQRRRHMPCDTPRPR